MMDIIIRLSIGETPGAFCMPIFNCGSKNHQTQLHSITNFLRL